MKRVKAREGNKAAAGENTLDLLSFLAPAGNNGWRCSCKFVGAKESRPSVVSFNNPLAAGSEAGNLSGPSLHIIN